MGMATISTDTVTLERLQVYARHYVSHEREQEWLKTLPQGNWSVRVDQLIDVPGLVVTMIGILWAETQTHEVHYPRDWWEAVRERWAPAWWLTRWPVQYQHWVVDARRGWKNLRVPEDWGQPYTVLHVQKPWRDTELED